MGGLPRILILVLLGSAVILANNEPVLQPNNNFLVEWKNHLTSAFKKTIEEEKQSLKNALDRAKKAASNVYLAGVDSAKATFDFYVIVPKAALYVLTSNDTVDAMKRPFRESGESIKKAFESMKTAVSDSVSAGAGIAKAGWDLSIVVPKFGLNLLPEQKERLEQALKLTYQQEEESVKRGISKVLSSAESMSEIGRQFIEISWDMGRAMPKIIIDLFKNQTTDEQLNREFLEVETNVTEVMSLIRNAGITLTTASLAVGEVGFDLSTVIPRYGLNLMKEEDRKNVLAVIEQQVRKAMSLVENTFDKIDAVGAKIKKATGSVINSQTKLNELLPKLNKDLLRQRALDLRHTIAEYLKKSSEAMQKVTAAIREAGRQISDSGKNLISASIDLAVAVPKFGFGFLSEQSDVFKAEIRAAFEKQKQSIIEVFNALKKAGLEIRNAGRDVLANTWLLQKEVPKIGQQSIEFEEPATSLEVVDYSRSDEPADQ